MRSCLQTAVFFLASALSCTAAYAQSCTKVSPEHTVALVELYTSQGCSSCPPADRWLQGFSSREVNFDSVVPLSLHVNYWDYIGWKDPFAQAKFTSRQREYARLRGTTTIYTPQVVLAGRDFPAWGTAVFERAVASQVKRPASVRLALTASVQGQSVVAETAVRPVRSVPDAQLHVVLFEMGLRSKVLRGENSGETLTNDFVVRQWQGPARVGQGLPAHLTQWALDAPMAGRRLGVASFAQAANGEVLQATACILK